MGLLRQSIEYFGNDRPAIFLGNGIHQCVGVIPTWKELLEDIGGANINSEGLTNTETYDFIELRAFDSDELKARIAQKFNDVINVHSEVYTNFLAVVRETNCPILTTNFDFTLQRNGNLNQFRTSRRGFTRYYP
jgi:hypothetical protein